MDLWFEIQLAWTRFCDTWEDWGLYLPWLRWIIIAALVLVPALAVFFCWDVEVFVTEHSTTVGITVMSSIIPMETKVEAYSIKLPRWSVWTSTRTVMHPVGYWVLATNDHSYPNPPALEGLVLVFEPKSARDQVRRSNTFDEIAEEAKGVIFFRELGDYLRVINSLDQQGKIYCGVRGFRVLGPKALHSNDVREELEGCFKKGRTGAIWVPTQDRVEETIHVTPTPTPTVTPHPNVSPPPEQKPPKQHWQNFYQDRWSKPS